MTEIRSKVFKIYMYVYVHKKANLVHAEKQHSDWLPKQFDFTIIMDHYNHHLPTQRSIHSSSVLPKVHICFSTQTKYFKPASQTR